MKHHAFALSVAMASVAIGCSGTATTDEDGLASAVTGGDTLSRPTDTKIQMVVGKPEQQVFTVKRGWHLLHFKAPSDGYVAVRMQADQDAQEDLWSYLKIIDPKTDNQAWASVGSNKTNLCEIILPVTKGTDYQVVATTQQNSIANDKGRPNSSVGGYTVVAYELKDRKF